MTFYRWGFDMVGVNAVDALTYGAPGPDVVILRDDEDDSPPQFHFSSQHLNELDDEREVRARAMQLKTLFDGALILREGLGYRPERMHELWALDRGARLGCPDPAPGVTTFSKKVCRQPLTRLEQGALQRKFVDAGIYRARTDDVVHGILLRLGTHGITWTTLYALTDTMSSNGFGETAQWQAAKSSKAEFKRFKHTANSAAVLGPEARHGETPHTPPSKPLDLERASDIVLAATRAFVLQRIAGHVMAPAKAPRPARATPTSAAVDAGAPGPARKAEGDGGPDASEDRTGIKARLATAALAAAVAVPILLALRIARRR